MKLLICTQAVDAEDPILGFFVRWIEEFAKYCERVTVVCLRAGVYDLPNNVDVAVIGKASRLMRAWRLLRVAYARRKKYDAIFVHMNPEYLVTAGLFWRFLKKRVALWYTHKQVNLKLRVAVLFANKIFTASKESFRLKTDKLRVVGHGIDTDFFRPDLSVDRQEFVLSIGRLMPSKRHDLAIHLAEQEKKELRIIGDGPELDNLKTLAKKLGANVRFLGALTRARVRDEYRKASLLIHTSETGSLDKVVLEALACGLHVRTNNPALKDLENVSPEYIKEHHSLQKLIPSILRSIQHHD